MSLIYFHYMLFILINWGVIRVLAFHIFEEVMDAVLSFNMQSWLTISFYVRRNNCFDECSCWLFYVWCCLSMEVNIYCWPIPSNSSRLLCQEAKLVCLFPGKIWERIRTIRGVPEGVEVEGSRIINRAGMAAEKNGNEGMLDAVNILAFFSCSCLRLPTIMC